MERKTPEKCRTSAKGEIRLVRLSTSNRDGFIVSSIGFSIRPTGSQSGKLDPCRFAEDREICGENLESAIRFVEKAGVVNSYTCSASHHVFAEETTMAIIEKPQTPDEQTRR